MKKFILVLFALALVSPINAMEKKTEDCEHLLSEQARKEKASETVTEDKKEEKSDEAKEE